MTQQADAPITRRALRAAASRPVRPEAPDAPSATTTTSPPPGAAQASPPLTRRALREAERAREAAARAHHATPAPRVPTQAPRTAEVRTTEHASTGEQAPRPVTRRELRLAAEAQRARARRPSATARRAPEVCRPPFAASLVVPAQTVRPSQARAVVARLGAKPLAVIALSASILVGGVSQVHAEQAHVAEQQAAAEQERVERVQRVTAARSAAQAAAIATERRTEALTVAQEAVDIAAQVKAKSADVVDPEVLASLEEATAELTRLLDAAPAVEALSAVSTDTVPQVDTQDVERAAATASGAAATPATEGPSQTAEDAVAAARSADRPSRSAVGREPVAQQVDRSAAVEAAADVLGTDRAGMERQLAALDLDTSDKILAAATQVAELSAEIEATADTIIAELEAQRAAEEAARRAAEEAARKAAEELARKVAVVQESPNGRVPADALCGVSFQSGVQLRCDAAAALERVNEAYRAEFGRDLRVVSSYRSYSAQVATKRSRGYLAARPGTSNHGHAIAVDLGDFGGVGNFSNANHRWMRENGPRFGWHHPEIMRPGGGGPQEPWHFEYQG